MKYNIVTDSRNVFEPEKALFVALKGVRHNGEDYIGELYARGVRNFVCTDCVKTELYPEAKFTIVKDALAELQRLAGEQRKKCSGKVLAITGSNGKTIVKEWIAFLLAEDVNMVRSPRSYNSQVGVPLSLMQVKEDTELAIIECGISKRGEMERLQRMVVPTDVMITNIADAHEENFESIEQKLGEKLNLLDGARRVFFSQQDALVVEALSEKRDLQKISWGTGENATFNVDYTVDNEGLRAWISSSELNVEKTFIINVYITNDALAHCLLHAVCFALAQGIGAQKIAKRAADVRPIEMRMSSKAGVNNCVVINDAYNADCASLGVALDMLHQMGARRGLTHTLILSDLVENNRHKKQLYEQVKELIEGKQVDRLICIGSEVTQYLGGISGARCFATTADFMRGMSTADFRNEAVLLKGSRAFMFEQIADMLEAHLNRTEMLVNLNALGHNVAYYRSKLSPDTKLLAMVKANAYGVGAFEVARYLQQSGVNYLGVAFADEGVELRNAGITLPIIVMNPEWHSYGAMIQYGLEPQISTREQLNRYSAEVSRQGVSDAAVHIKINTGMTRSGFEPDEIELAARSVLACGNLRVVTAFSHLSSADMPDEESDAYTQKQISVFKETTALLEEKLGYKVIKHCLNSAGIERFGDSQMDMVRLGIGLYGVSAVDNRLLMNVATLRSYVAQVREVETGTCIGYGRHTVVTRPSKIAVVPIGYADGINRRLGNRAWQVEVNGVKADIVGNVCMDIIMVDVTDVPHVKPGNDVVLFGDDNAVWEMADVIGTIPYEVLTGIGKRVKRVYYIE